MAAVLLPPTFMHQHSYHIHRKKAVCICWAEPWSVKTVTQLYSCEVQALGWLKEMKWFSWHLWRSLYYCVAARGVKSLHRTQQQPAKRPPTMGMAHQALNLVTHIWQGCAISRSTPSYLGKQVDDDGYISLCSTV